MAQISASAFTAFFDASGHPSDQPFVVVSGYIANYYQWHYFTEAWKTVHKRFGVELPFHMVEFMAREKQNARDDYKKWPIDSPEAQEFLLELCKVQQVYLLFSFSCIVDMGTYRDFNDAFMLETMLPAFALGARTCVEHIEVWQAESDLKYPVECIFEDGDFGRGKFIELMRVEKMPAPIFKDAKDFAGLQAADHLAWEQAHYLKKKRGNPTGPTRESFSRLLAIPHRHTNTTLASLLAIAERKGIEVKRGKIIIP